MSKDKKPPTLSIIDGSKKPEPNKTNDKEQCFGDYTIINNAFYHLITVRGSGDKIPTPLCNFTCRFLEEIVNDNGLTDTSFLRIEGKRSDGVILPLVDVHAKDFYSTLHNWPNEVWGTIPFIYPGNAKRDNLRAAIHLYSVLNGDIPRRTVYGYTGWKKINEAWHYLTGSGAITATGLIDNVQVEMGAGHMSRYVLPAPLTCEQLKKAANEVLNLPDICPGKKHIGLTLLAAMARAPLGECQCTDFIIWLHGPTGSKKSSLAALPLAAFGDFTARSFPANFSDTINDTDGKAFQTKDSVFVVDDFKPSTSLIEANKMHAAAERFIRGTGNQQGRGRRDGDMRAKPAPYNRSLTICTGEDLPRGQSILGRALILELLAKDVNNHTLTRLQRAAAAGQFSGLMAAYLQWLAPQIDKLKHDFPKRVIQTRDQAIADEICRSHPRAPENYANLVAGLDVFCDFLQAQAGLSIEDCCALQAEAETELRQLFDEQESYLRDQDEVERFLQLTRAALSSGCCHIAYSLNQGPPSSRPYAWGWRSDAVDASGEPILKPLGDCIGWFYEDQNDNLSEVWFQQETVFKIVQQFARSSGEPFLLGQATLWRRLFDKGFLLYFESRIDRSRPRLSVKRMVAGRSIRVMILAAKTIESGSE